MCLPKLLYLKVPFPERLFARRWQSEIRGESLGGSVEIVEGAMADVAIVMALNLMSGGLGLGLKNLDAFLAFVVFVGKMAVVPHVLRAVPVVVEVLVASEALKIGNAVAGGLPVLVTGAPAAGEAAIAIPAFIHVEAWRDLLIRKGWRGDMSPFGWSSRLCLVMMATFNAVPDARGKFGEVEKASKIESTRTLKGPQNIFGDGRLPAWYRSTGAEPWARCFI